MIRVGFIVPDSDDSWLGCTNYYRNLLSALTILDHRRVQPVVFTGSDDTFDHLQGVEVIHTKWLQSEGAARVVWKMSRRVALARDAILAFMLARHDIDVLSHFGSLGSGAHIRTIGWIADFQHVYLPDFFNAKELRRRNKLFKAICEKCDRVVVSSEAALHDLLAFSPGVIAKSRVLQFVPEVDLASLKKPLEALEHEYDFKGPYFLLPHQFWVHKNHRVVVLALAELQKMGVEVTVLATGKTEDYRHVRHFVELMAQVRQLGVTRQFRVLGVIPYADLMDLMRCSIAVINPSLFEGWSTSIEEAKVLRKPVLLSNLRVHREQTPEFATYFEPTDSAALAQAMIAVMNESGATRAPESESVYMSTYRQRRSDFARAYEEIAVSVVNGSQSGDR